MKILVDARLYGPKHTGNGRYTENLINNLIKIDQKNDYFILLKKEDFDVLKFPKNFVKILADFKHYSFEEQLKLPLILLKTKPDLVHFPHFNVPLFYFGKYIVTIHDLTMHKYSSGAATTRKFPVYQIWRIGYHLVFAKAIYGSKKIIVPSYAIRDEIVKFYRINPKKVEVTYEG